MIGNHRARRLFALAAIVAGTVAGGCTAEIAKRTGYETLHNVSDIQNDANPKYDPGPRPAYDVYRDQREQILRPAPEPPLPPPAPAPAPAIVK